MSTARGALSVVGQAVGAYFGGPIGAAAGGIIGGEIGGLIDGPPEGPRLDDLSAPQIQYGGKIPRFYGGPRWFEIAPLWMTEKREDSETVGGKGGDSGVEQFSYRIDMLVRVCESREGTPCEVIAVTGVEVDGQLVWTSLADASAESIAASAEQEIWADMAVQLGHEDQAPWSVMEAAVGTANANAYRGYLTVGFQDFLLGNLGAPRRVRIQAITSGTSAPAEGSGSPVYGVIRTGAGVSDPWIQPVPDGIDAPDPGGGVWDTRTDEPGAAQPNEAIVTELMRLSLADYNGAAVEQFDDCSIDTGTGAENDPWDGLCRYIPTETYLGNGNGVVLLGYTQQTQVWTPTPVPLRDILEYEAERCAPLTAANIDFSAADGLTVDCHVAIGSAAEAMQPLLTRFWFDLYSADKLYLVRRGGDVEQTIAYRWSGAGVGGRSEAFAGLKRSNDVEVGRRKAITYANILADGESDTRTGDRESISSDVDTLSMNLNMIPSEAQGLADTATADARVAGHTATVRLGARHGLLLQAGSVLEFVDHQGNTYRTLVRRAVWDRWVWEVEVRLDDPAVLQAAGIAVDLDQRALTVAPPPEATLYVLDIPLLRQQDDGPGEYVAVTQTGRNRGVDIYKSSDDITYAQIGERLTTRATAGVCDSVLPPHDGWAWDNASVLTVTLDDGSGGTLSSATKEAIEASRSLNLAAVGAHGRWELVQFATATLVTGSTYELSGFLRNLFGTEWANGDHAADDSFVLLQSSGLARVPGSIADLGQTRYYKAVPAGRSVSQAVAASIVCEERGLLPYAPVDIVNDNGTARWNRRSRYPGAIGLDPPLGEASERYDVELYDGVTLVASDTVDEPAWLLPALTHEASLAVPCMALLSVGGDIMGIRDDAPQANNQPHYVVRHTAAGAFVEQSPNIGNVYTQWVANGDDLIVATYNLTPTTPQFYSTTRAQRFERTDLSAAAATNTAGTNGDYYGLAFDGTDVWVSEYLSGNLRNLDASTLASAADYPLAGGPTALAFTSGDLLVCCMDSNELVRWDIATTSEVYRVATGSFPADIVVVGSLLFVLCLGEVVVHNLSDGSIADRHDCSPVLAGQAQRNAAEFGDYVVIVDGTLRLLLLDKTAGSVVGYVATPPNNRFFGVAGVLGGYLWLTYEPAGAGASSVVTRGFSLDSLDTSGMTLRVYQLSELVGRGHVAEKVLS